MRIALTGNPNSGKTTTFNALTGRNEKVGNWAGVTVDKKEYSIKKSFHNSKENLIAIDLPGAYSMSPFTSEESITSSYVKNENPDVIINVVDATNLSRSLFFTTQLLELGIPLVIALNKCDIIKKNGVSIDTALLSKKLGCPVVETISTDSKGLDLLIKTALEASTKNQIAPFKGDDNLTSKEAAAEADRKRFAFVNSITSDVLKRKKPASAKTLTDKIDTLLVNKWLGIPVFAIVMFLVFQISQGWVGQWLADLLVGKLEVFQAYIGSFFENANPLLYALLIDGVVGGVIAVVGFLPLVMVMYFLIALLEDCGYMARASVVLDPIFKRVGLSGKSVIPFVITTGCAVPGIMASRTIRDEKERRATAMLAPFMPCGAKLPVIALFAGSFFGGAGWVGTTMYFMGIVFILIGAIIINKITGSKVRKSFFIMELPEYKLPSLKRAFYSMLSRGWAFIVKAATIILLCNTAVHIMQTFTFGLSVAENPIDSILAGVAQPFAYILLPITGVVSWQLAASVLTGFIAKENVVGTLAVCFATANIAAVSGLDQIGALSYLMFCLFSPPCFAALSAMRSELGSRKWFWGGIGLQLGVAYTISFIVYNGGKLLEKLYSSSEFFRSLVLVLKTNFPIVLVLLLILGLAIGYIIKFKKEKQQSVSCIGCGSGCTSGCGGNCTNCTSSGNCTTCKNKNN